MPFNLVCRVLGSLKGNRRPVKKVCLDDLMWAEKINKTETVLVWAIDGPRSRPLRSIDGGVAGVESEQETLLRSKLETGC